MTITTSDINKHKLLYLLQIQSGNAKVLVCHVCNEKIEVYVCYDNKPIVTMHAYCMATHGLCYDCCTKQNIYLPSDVVKDYLYSGDNPFAEEHDN